ncbi:hypothetical protein EMIHUDRAFT_209224 [Emiliania huxleyi CCMP1516]|uniref:Uncharacterized protein n=2 Tax=Emiliania huxleyi TaxID=2903 RepID=A0A0D3J7W0_EMIH1|nr:hypothetical protein EMIHUDRAFT_209224 [Emiliania huxleyi CCMP1516]EOD19595.1 hypothetical protein EMIHUDRAFT_209224 [Emiliania huxleyi CCMP1516]|eukprot:XP_005772024.1 hypothetical protein EMIHUDRAFT_209224 [Emiliania huxleyi CCMP1516]
MLHRKATLTEYGAAAPWALNFGSIAAQRLLPAYVRWLQSRGPDLVVYCPVAHFASVKLAIPDVSLLTAAGPGFFDAAIASTPGAPSSDALIAAIKGSEPNLKAVEALKAEMGLPELTLNTETGLPLICDYYAATNLVTTTPELADPVSKRDEEYYSKVGKKFVYVGPLLDVAGAKRAGGMLHAGGSEADSSPPATEALMARATTAARMIVYVSLGTVVTSDDESHGWTATSGSAITGRQLCQASCSAAREARRWVPTALKMAPRPQPAAFEGIDVPSNSLSASSWPQVDLLRKARPVLFVTNGGQNSLMESAAVGTPVVVCPGFGDQVTNAAKVVAQGWGVAVDRPAALADGAEAEEEAAVVSSYQAAVRRAVEEVLGGEYASKAKAVAAGLERAGGVEAAVRVLLEVANV